VSGCPHPWLNFCSGWCFLAPAVLHNAFLMQQCTTPTSSKHWSLSFQYFSVSLITVYLFSVDIQWTPTLLFGDWFSISRGSLHVSFECKYFCSVFSHEGSKLSQNRLMWSCTVATLFRFTEMQIKGWSIYCWGTEYYKAPIAKVLSLSTTPHISSLLQGYARWI
jgi:hypothetical protein